MDFPKFTLKYESQWEFPFIISEMAKESSLQNLPISWFAKEAYHVVKILHKYNGVRRNNGYWSETFFNISLKENIAFVKLFETSLVVTYLSHLLNFSVKALILLVLFECKNF